MKKNRPGLPLWRDLRWEIFSHGRLLCRSRNNNYNLRRATLLRVHDLSSEVIEALPRDTACEDEGVEPALLEDAKEEVWRVKRKKKPNDL